MQSRDAATPAPKTPLQVLISDEFLALLRECGVVEAALFGSVARGTATPESDIDLLVTFDRPVTLFDQLRLADRLQEIAGRRVDLMTELHTAFATAISQTLVPLPLPL